MFLINNQTKKSIDNNAIAIKKNYLGNLHIWALAQTF